MLRKVKESIVYKVILIFLCGAFLSCSLISMRLYDSYSDLLEEDMNKLLLRDVNIVAQNIDTMIEQIVKIYRQIQVDDTVYHILKKTVKEDVITRAEEKRYIKTSVLLYHQLLLEYETNLFLLDTHGNVYTQYSTSGTSKRLSEVGEEIREKYITPYELDVPKVYLMDTEKELFSDIMFTFVCPLRRGTNNYGYLVFFVDKSMLTDAVVKDKNDDQEYEMIVANQEKHIIFHTDKDKIGEEISMVYSVEELEQSEKETVIKNGQEWILTQKETKNYSLVYAVNIAERKVILYKNVVLMVGIVALILFGVMLGQLYFIKRMTNSLFVLSSYFEKISNGEYGMQIPVKGKDEIAKVVFIFNQMSQKIKEQVENIKWQEKNRMKLEIMAYQARINPHFVFNTLNAIKWMALQKQTDQIAEAISNLGSIMEKSFRQTETIHVLSEEIKMTEKYVNIEKLRYQDRFEVMWNVEPELEACYIPMLTLQPLIENAIFHGLGRKKQIHIFVEVYKRNEIMEILIADDGIGMSEKMQKKIFEKKVEKEKHLGILAVHKRIELMFGKEYGITIKSEINKGTTIIIAMPIIRNMQEDMGEKLDDMHSQNDADT